MAPTRIDRRSALKGLAAGTAALAVPRVFDPAAAAAPAAKGIFGYGVASGDPTGTSVVIWTRATPPSTGGEPLAAPGSGLGKPLQVRWEVARDADFRHVVARGNVRTSADSDHTVKVDVTGLSPYTRYHYRFSSRGETSPVGRTRTAPDVPGEVHALRFALVSCSNYTGGYFTAYRAIAQRDDLDLVLHVGDYIYEYGNTEPGRYGPPELIGVRDAQPETETIDLEGYRLRHALHKADPDAQAAHRALPWITIFDDHEVANNSWADGAENHQADEGAYLARRADAMKAYLEWMPFRLPDQSVPHQGTQFFKRFTFGALADLSVLETRQNRSEQATSEQSPLDGFVPLGVPATDAVIADPNRHLPEPQQMQWLRDGLAAQGRSWHLLGNQVMVTPVRYPGAALGLSGLFVNADQWDGYAADQAALLGHLAVQPPSAGDAVVLTGDIHSSWGADLPVGVGAGGTYTSVGVEFVTPSVTSDGFYEIVRGFLGGPSPEVAVAATRQVTGAVRQVNPWVRYLDGIGHGFTVIDVTPQRVQADFHHTPLPSTGHPDPRVEESVVPVYSGSLQTLAGTRRLSTASGPVGARSDQPA